MCDSQFLIWTYPIIWSWITICKITSSSDQFVQHFIQTESRESQFVFERIITSNLIFSNISSIYLHNIAIFASHFLPFPVLLQINIYIFSLSAIIYISIFLRYLTTTPYEYTFIYILYINGKWLYQPILRYTITMDAL